MAQPLLEKIGMYAYVYVYVKCILYRYKQDMVWRPLSSQIQQALHARLHQCRNDD